jgi:hypothetical protein
VQPAGSPNGRHRADYPGDYPGQHEVAEAIDLRRPEPSPVQSVDHVREAGLVGPDEGRTDSHLPGSESDDRGSPPSWTRHEGVEKSQTYGRSWCRDENDSEVRGNPLVPAETGLNVAKAPGVSRIYCPPDGWAVDEHHSQAAHVPDNDHRDQRLKTAGHGATAQLLFADKHKPRPGPHKTVPNGTSPLTSSIAAPSSKFGVEARLFQFGSWPPIWWQAWCWVAGAKRSVPRKCGRGRWLWPTGARRLCPGHRGAPAISGHEPPVFCSDATHTPRRRRRRQPGALRSGRKRAGPAARRGDRKGPDRRQAVARAMSREPRKRRQPAARGRASTARQTEITTPWPPPSVKP